jgi:hypothetical protein
VTVANGEQLPAAELVAFVDVAARNDAEQLATRDLTLRELPPDGALHEIVLPFELAETTFGVQFRLYTTGRVSVFARSQVELEEDSAAPGPAASPEITEPRAAPEAQAASPPAEDAASNEAPPAAVQRDRREDGPVSTPAPARSSDGAPARYEVSLPRRVGRILLWPFLRFFDPRFQGLAEQLEAKHEDLGWRVDRSKDEAARTHVLVSRLRTESGTVRNETLAALDEIRILLHMEITNAAEATTQLGASLVDLESLVEGGRADLARLRSSTSRKQAADERTARQIDEIAAESHRIIETTADLRRESRGMQEALAEVAAAARGAQEEASKASGAYLEQLASVDASQLDSRVAPLLERENTPTGLAARHGLWFNPPVYVGYESTVPVVRGVNERIAENAYAFAAIAGLELGAPILDVGAAESLTAFSLASLGYPVTALDPRGYPLPHPLLQVVTVPIQDWQTEDRYAAVLCISTIEHVGLPAYGLRPAEGRADLAAMRRIWELTAPGGLLVLTTPYGQPNETAFSRTYDRAGLDELLDRWQLEDFRLLGREDGTTWRVVDAVADAASGEAVALVTARRSG